MYMYVQTRTDGDIYYIVWSGDEEITAEMWPGDEVDDSWSFFPNVDEYLFNT